MDKEAIDATDLFQRKAVEHKEKLPDLKGEKLWQSKAGKSENNKPRTK